MKNLFQQHPMHWTALCLMLLLGLSGTLQAGSAIGTLSKSELETRIKAGSAPLILDVRTPSEYSAGHVPGAVNIPHTELAERLSELGIGQDEPLVVYCRSGKRAAMAESVLLEQGYTQVLDLEGHWLGWSQHQPTP